MNSTRQGFEQSTANAEFNDKITFSGLKFPKPPVEKQFNRNGLHSVLPRRRSHSNQNGVTIILPPKKLKNPKSIQGDITVTPSMFTKRSGWGTGLSLRNLVLWWDSPRLIARTSAGRRPATVALCSSSIKPQGKFARNRWPGPQQSARRLSHTFCAHPLHNPDPSVSPARLTDSARQHVPAVSRVPCSCSMSPTGRVSG